jgi:hypothetical protein
MNVDVLIEQNSAYFLERFGSYFIVLSRIPTTLFVDERGKIIHKLSGFDQKGGLTRTEKIINKYLNSTKY